jgi:hypothetical protein
MTHRERFQSLLRGEPVDHVPLYYFGTWRETKIRWMNEGLETAGDLAPDAGPQVPGMDPDWEESMWGCQGLVHSYLIGDGKVEIISEDEDFILKRNEYGDLVRESRRGTSTPFLIEASLQPSRESWEKFRKLLDARDPRRYPARWEQAAGRLRESDKVLSFMGGSLYGWLRNWMGIEALSFLIHDDPVLLEDMVSHIADFFIQIMSPVLSAVQFDFVYFFEDCCGAEGPLFSPDTYRRIFDKYYRRMIAFYKGKGVPWALIDSDGNVERFAPLWLDSGFDMLFPLECANGEPPHARSAECWGRM